MYADEFALDDGIVHLNHAAVAPWPRRTAAAVSAFADENMRYGSRGYANWMQTEQRLREQLRALINAASADEIALLKNTSEALSVVAWGLPWKAGDNVVISDQEFPSNRVVWESLAGLGVTTHAVSLSGPATPEQALIERIDAGTRLLSVSSVQYGSGLRLDLETLGQACRERGVLFCVDAIQSIGALQFDVQACQADFVMADGHKWMLGPEGVALFYCRRAVMDRLTLRQYGWHMLANHHDFDDHSDRIADSARRFECGSPNMTGIHALQASLELLLETGMATIERQVLDNSAYLLEQLAARNDRYRIMTSCAADRYAGIVTFAPLQDTVQACFDRLRDGGVLCALRGGGIRFSPHYYTPRERLNTALDLLDR